mgnify:FL=1
MSNINILDQISARRLDTSGLRCPVPIMRTKREISKLTSGEKLLVIATDPSFKVDCLVFIRQTGHMLLNSWQEGDKFYYLLQSTAN